MYQSFFRTLLSDIGVYGIANITFLFWCVTMVTVRRYLYLWLVLVIICGMAVLFIILAIVGLKKRKTVMLLPLLIFLIIMPSVMIILLLFSLEQDIQNIIDGNEHMEFNMKVCFFFLDFLAFLGVLCNIFITMNFIQELHIHSPVVNQDLFQLGD